MRARVIKEGEFWVGQVYGIWLVFHRFIERVRWSSVTDKCYTQWGAKLSLKVWKRTKCQRSLNHEFLVTG